MTMIAAPALAAVSSGQAGTLGLVVVLLLAVATWLLLRSMNTQLKKVPKSFDAPANRPVDGSPDDPGQEPGRR